MHSLPIFVNLRDQPVLLVGEGEMAEPKRALLVRAGAVVNSITADDPGQPLPPARLAIVAIEDEVLAAQWAARLRGQGLLINTVDKPALCDFSIPAIVDRNPVLIAVGTGGASASLAKALRERLETLLPAGLGSLASAIRQARDQVSTVLPTPRERRRFWDQVLAPGGLLDPTREPPANPQEAIAAALASAPVQSLAPQTITLASADPDDLTIGMLRAMQVADVLIAVGVVSTQVLDRARRDAVIERCETLIEAHRAAAAHAEAGRLAVLIRASQ
jgi:uroporphyrin-III C-methyltransferase / precorrin-2 dehydrogenase / sirohydrochlorin ferrochelatase